MSENELNYENTYKAFLLEKRIKTNKTLCIVLWFCVLAGPLIALLKLTGIYPNISYAACLTVTLLTAGIAMIHQVLYFMKPNLRITSIVALLGIDLLLYLMANAHIGIYITFFLVPLMSILFFDRRLFVISSIVNYLVMALTMWSIAPRFAQDSVNYNGNEVAWFIGMMGGLTIEMIIMVAAGYVLARSIDHSMFQFYQERKMGQTDMMTDIFNRRAYDEDAGMLQGAELPENLIYFSFDINCLKMINDSRGHQAGDEMICGVSDCVGSVLNPLGRIYRTGGDEFAAIIYTDESAENLKKRIQTEIENWKGVRVEKIDISIGYAERRDYPYSDILALEKIAEEMMLREKNRFYHENAMDHRGQHNYMMAMEDTCQTIMMLNLSTDSYYTVKSEREAERHHTGIRQGLSDLFREDAMAGNIHPDDVKEYLEKTSADYLKRHFSGGEWTYYLFYRRKRNDYYEKTLVEIIKSEEYRADNQIFFYYRKCIQ